jgi:hypothetical protein
VGDITPHDGISPEEKTRRENVSFLLQPASVALKRGKRPPWSTS